MSCWLRSTKYLAAARCARSGQRHLSASSPTAGGCSVVKPLPLLLPQSGRVALVSVILSRSLSASPTSLAAAAASAEAAAATATTGVKVGEASTGAAASLASSPTPPPAPAPATPTAPPAAPVAHATTDGGREELVLDLIPDRPSPSTATALGDGGILPADLEPTLYSLGLGSWWPSGRMQCVLEWLHVSGDLPWWGCIVVGSVRIAVFTIKKKRKKTTLFFPLPVTVALRVLTFPLVIMAQKNAAKLANNAPEMQASGSTCL